MVFIAFSCGRRGTAVAVDEEKNDISRQILLQIFYQHLIRQPAAATFRPCLGDADRVRLRESVNSPLGKAFFSGYLYALIKTYF